MKSAILRRRIRISYQGRFPYIRSTIRPPETKRFWKRLSRCQNGWLPVIMTWQHEKSSGFLPISLGVADNLHVIWSRNRSLCRFGHMLMGTELVQCSVNFGSLQLFVHGQLVYRGRIIKFCHSNQNSNSKNVFGRSQEIPVCTWHTHNMYTVYDLVQIKEDYYIADAVEDGNQLRQP